MSNTTVTKQQMLSRLEKFLSIRPRSEKEIYDYIVVRRKQSPELAREVIAELKRLGILNDSMFAKWYFDNRLTYSKFGISRIQMELKQKGISTEILAEVMAGYDKEDLSHELNKKIEREVDRVIRLNKTTEKAKLQEKILRSLLSKGYNYEQIKELIAQKLEALL